MRKSTWLLSAAVLSLATPAFGQTAQSNTDTDKAGAQRYAAADLQRAHDELSNAERSNGEKKYDEARRYAESAEADADVATARASAGEAQRAAHEVGQGNETLRQETDRSTSSPDPNPDQSSPRANPNPN